MQCRTSPLAPMIEDLMARTETRTFIQFLDERTTEKVFEALVRSLDPEAQFERNYALGWSGIALNGAPFLIFDFETRSFASGYLYRAKMAKLSLARHRRELADHEAILAERSANPGWSRLVAAEISRIKQVNESRPFWRREPVDQAAAEETVIRRLQLVNEITQAHIAWCEAEIERMEAVRPLLEEKYAFFAQLLQQAGFAEVDADILIDRAKLAA